MNTPTKVCKICHAELPATTEFFYAHSECKHGVTNVCKSCIIQREEARRRSQGVVSRSHQPDEPVACTKCGTVYPWNSEYFTVEKGKHHQPCKQCNRNRAIEWQDKHPERAAERKRIHAQKPEQREKRRIYQQQHPEKHHQYYLKRRAAHLVKAREWAKANPERAREIRKQSRARHPETGRIITHRRLARKRALPDTLTKQQWLNCLDYWHHRCAYCGRQHGFLPGMKITTEHVIALADPRCPGTTAENIVPACQSCNSSKGDTDVLVWLNRVYSPKKAQNIYNRIQVYFQQVRASCKLHP